MRLVLFVLIPLLAAGCTFKPMLLTDSVPEPVNKPAVTTAAIQVLQTRGYTIALANEQTGTVTTEWADATGTLTTILSVGKGSMRQRIMVSVSPNGEYVNVQFTKQAKTEGKGDWKNTRIGKKEKQESHEILQEIVRFASSNSSTPQLSP